jgi:hypothetical protein
MYTSMASIRAMVKTTAPTEIPAMAAVLSGAFGLGVGVPSGLDDVAVEVPGFWPNGVVVMDGVIWLPLGVPDGVTTGAVAETGKLDGRVTLLWVAQILELRL